MPIFTQEPARDPVNDYIFYGCVSVLALAAVTVLYNLYNGFEDRDPNRIYVKGEIVRLPTRKEEGGQLEFKF